VYGSLADVPAPVDIVDIFRNSAAALEVVREAIRLKETLGIKVVWMQLGVRNDEAAAEAEAAGLQVVMNRCPKIEYGRLSGEIGWAGVNAGTITAKRPLLGGHGVQNHVIATKPQIVRISLGFSDQGPAYPKHADNLWMAGLDALKHQGTGASVARS
jgi:hypothetical protein